MRVKHVWFVWFLIMNCCNSQISSSFTVADTIPKQKIKNDSLFCINFRRLTGYAKYAERYKIVNDINTSYRPIEINYLLQNFIRTNRYDDAALLNCYYFVNENLQDGKQLYSDFASYNPVSEKELFYGVWRNQLVRSSSDFEISKSITEGTKTLIDLGYSNLSSDFFPFITRLMEEQHIVNYDLTRTKGFSAGSKGIVTSVEVLKALGSQNSQNKIGVCRDIHEAGRQFLKTMCEVYYKHFYPERTIDFDEYIYLQSWTTQASQHVTISLIDPLNTKKVYELDWGRVIERNNINGYNNGRLYGNTYRIWQYNKKTQRSEPIDFKRTQFGKILDEDVLTSDEYRQFNGIYDQESYSNIRYLKSMGKYGNLNFSAGMYYPEQLYFLSSYSLNTEKKEFAKIFNHSNTIALQAAIHEDSRKKELLYPQADWELTASLMSVPRIISKFETKKAEITKNIAFSAFLNQQLDVFLIVSKFQINDSINYVKIPKSGDANLSFSNGVNIDFRSPNNTFLSTLIFQTRSCLLPKDIRLFSPNPLVLFPNIRFITPAMDIISKSQIKFIDKSFLAFDAMVELTNKNALLFSTIISANIYLSKDYYFISSIGKNDQIKGMNYFWYPVSRSWIDFQLVGNSDAYSISLLKYPQSQISLNFSYKRYLR